MISLPNAEDELGSVADHTDDYLAEHINQLRRLAEALAITTPRRFGDAVNFLTIDPAQARVQAAGTARATRYLHTSLVGYEDFVHVTGANIGRVRFSDNAEYTADWVATLPPWVDTFDDFTLYVPAQPCVEDTVLMYRLFVELIRNGSALNSVVHDSTQTAFVFENGLFGARSLHVLYVPFVTFNAGVAQLQANDQLHVNLTRYAAAAEDTIATTWWVVGSPFFKVKQKELA